MQILENVPLAPLTTLQIGGPARYFAEANTRDEVKEAAAYAKAHALPLFILGGGSNLVVADAGWPGLVLKIAILGINHRHVLGNAAFDVGAGENWDEFVAIAVKHRCSGIECLSGIPGTVGGTPIQNVGAYGQEVADTVESVVALNLETQQEEEFAADECGFDYRTSIFNKNLKGRYIVLQVSYSLKHNGAAHIAYADLKKYFEHAPHPPTLAETRDAVRAIRASKAMLITPGDEDSRSAGSFFKNPVLSADQFEKLDQQVLAKGLQIPNYPADDNRRKVSAAWLVEHSGFSKGFGEGRVGISRKHTLAIVNRGGATAADVVAFKNQIQSGVESAWGIALETEPVFVGF